MSHLIIKTVKLTLWGLLPMFLGTTGEHHWIFTEGNRMSGTYRLRAAGERNLQLDGTIYYESIREVQADGESYAILKFHLAPPGMDASHSLGFYIAQRKEAGLPDRGTYRIAEQIDCFLRRYNGVFAFANINALGEQPFFANGGKLSIDYVVPEAVGGSLAITMRNAKGKTIAVSGDFMATRKN